MYDRILFPTDGSETAASALEYALDVASEHDATIHVLNVVDPAADRETVGDESETIGDESETGGDESGTIDVESLEESGKRIVEDAAARARDRGVPVETAIRRGDPHEGIVAYGEESGIDLVVMPTHGRRGLERALLGSVTERVINSAEVPVLTVTPDEQGDLTYPCRDVLVPTDGSRGANLALTEGIGFAKLTGATLHVLTVVETHSLGLDTRPEMETDRLDERAAEIVAEATEAAEAASLDSIESAIERGRAYREIRSYAEENDVDLIAISTHGQTDFSRSVLGSVTAKLLRTSPCPVLLVREARTEGSGGAT